MPSYYIDTGVLQENTPLLKFIRNCMHPGPEWRIFHIPTSEDIDDVISRFFTTVCVGVVVCLYNKKNIARQLKNMNFMFEWQEQYLSMFFPLKH